MKIAHNQDDKQLKLVKTLCSVYPDQMSCLFSFTLKPSTFIFPSVDSEAYVRYICGELGVSICND